MKQDWPSQHPIAFIVIMGFVMMVMMFIIGVFIDVFTSWHPKEFVIRIILNTLDDMPLVIIMLFLYRFITTGQISDVHSKTYVDSRK